MDASLYEYTLINLTKCGINGSEPNKIDDRVDLKLLCKLARIHSLINVIYEPLSKANVLEAELKKEMFQYNNIGIMNDTVQIYYLDQITDLFEKNEIPHCVMKGPILKKLYPQSYYRQSGDLDIYVPEKYREKAKDIMLSLGFEIERYRIDDADDVYFMPNKIHIELHRVLISNKTPWQAECQKIADRLVLADDKKYSYKMTDEDYYLYMIAHMAKHMKYSGFGIKMVLDVWIYMKKYGNTLSRSVLNERLCLCGLDEFEKNILSLVEYWFEGGQASEMIKKLARYVFLSGTFGTREQLDSYFMIENSDGANNKYAAKFNSYRHSLFPTFEAMSKRYSILKKYPALLPILWVYRFFEILMFDRRKFKEVIKRYDNTDLDESKRIFDFKKQIGL